MTKVAIDNPTLAQDVREYLRVSGHEVSDETPVSITLPGSAKTPQRCASGSGIMTSGGRFAPGYDAKLKSALYAIIRGEPNKVPAELVENGPMYIALDQWTPSKAEAVLRENGWPLPTVKVKKEKAPKAEANGDGEADSTEEPPKTRRSPTKADRAKLKEQATA